MTGAVLHVNRNHRVFHISLFFSGFGQLYHRIFPPFQQKSQNISYLSLFFQVLSDQIRESFLNFNKNHRVFHFSLFFFFWVSGGCITESFPPFNRNLRVFHISPFLSGFRQPYHRILPPFQQKSQSISHFSLSFRFWAALSQGLTSISIEQSTLYFP